MTRGNGNQIGYCYTKKLAHYISDHYLPRRISTFAKLYKARRKTW